MTRKYIKMAGTSLIALLGSLQVSMADTTVSFWHSFNPEKANGKALNTIIANFEAANPGITIEGEFIGNYNDIVTKLQAAIPAHREPDAVIMEVTRYGLFADRGILTDLTPYLTNDPLKDNLFDFAREADRPR
ncbi:extracellular solute-binding protein [Cohaesibacter celericrescens]|uniref:Extracellular solute-binding protein n=1 Tax=Cohaesibacter celericrescens TaxID=2067669 RepID=A0A2N5XLY6_9HYPH|nr:extracellular solute-binding protein [Cohaesibacter celericrescens]PLW75440.1 hypothetical protein C0081_19965 [Cohaesibacter celericrescens]